MISFPGLTQQRSKLRQFLDSLSITLTLNLLFQVQAEIEVVQLKQYN